MDDGWGDYTPTNPAPRILKRPQAQMVDNDAQDEGVAQTPAHAVSPFLACVLSTEHCDADAYDSTASFVMLVSSIAALHSV